MADSGDHEVELDITGPEAAQPGTAGPGRTDPELVVERVLATVEHVPPGRVVSYGDVADLVGTSPRRVGAIMASHGRFVPWWRVTSSYGDVPTHLRDRAWPHWDDEGIERKPNGLGCRIADHRADLGDLADRVPGLPG